MHRASHRAQKHAIGGHLTFEVQSRMGRGARLLADIEDHYRHSTYGVASVADGRSDLLVQVGAFEPDISGCEVLEGGMLYAKPGYVFAPRVWHKMGGWWAFDVSGLGQATCILRVDGNPQGLAMVRGAVVDFFVHYALIKKGYPLLHASAVAKHGRAVAFSGPGGSGKSTIAMECVLRNGCHFISDNYVVCSAEDVTGYPAPVNIFYYNLRREVWQAMDTAERVALLLWSTVYAASGGYIKNLRPVSPQKLFGTRIVDRARLDAVCLLLRSEEFALREIPRKEAVARLAANVKLEFRRFVLCARLYTSACGRTDFGHWWNLLECGIEVTVPADVKFYEAAVPAEIRPSHVKRLLEVLS